MQNDITTSLGWFRELYSFLAGGLATGVFIKLLDRWLLRQKRAVDAERTAAETRRIHAETDIEINKSVARSTVQIERMRLQLNAMQLRLGQRDIELQLAQSDIKKLKALLDYHEIPYSEYDTKNLKDKQP